MNDLQEISNPEFEYRKHEDLLQRYGNHPSADARFIHEIRWSIKKFIRRLKF